ncbi:MAG: bifunctional N(6)-L-threonylcarbamoyladenine synthase/serine/threonine protein kinase [Candidatus Parvarchaeota archaeon]|nr:bifunctional N(6)-L-threonylcarbamoyladenine synthase/serine/threonine protein kinase [Candidatus Jingweiarchaeum tengchongense]MCW1297674.1 bifunctional N(6)-L-threonylcarbamoyladenine synthase/serine/threonine protein kinase [Candidatus Jingweiarchaeum tengchongense]MCW1304347.1 bifunctional N(6)-L-threonylcarbamoyladenine synthase/serine/threonine protein kinase [Candidatus Jingweiarchaeum tengchongense]MCW1311188.1 bifunctional N(6)-L-threonylcarbamoyladenine synthase/serine/threonine pro
MICLGIEGTAHTFGIGILSEDGKVLANAKKVYSPQEGFGIKPVEAAEHHKKFSEDVLNEALERAKIKLSDVDLIAFSQGPGLPPCLSVTLKKAIEIAKRIKKPIVGVNHCIAHLEIGRLICKCSDPVMLYVSGGNTQVIAFSEGKYRVFGETLDITIGNLLDCFARAANLPFPGGPKIEELAKRGTKYIQLPYRVKGMDVSFTGILTLLEKKLKENKIEDLCYSLQETTFAMLVEVSERAIAHLRKNELLLTGGVAANKRLQEMCEVMCRERGAGFYVVPHEYAGDCGANIAWTGILAKNNSTRNFGKIKIKPKWRTDDVSVDWR